MRNGDRVSPDLPPAPFINETIKAFGHERTTTAIGRRGKPVKKLRLIPA
jgi:hypothetical protein